MPMQFDLQDIASSTVLCWLATTDIHGQPNVSPKEVFHLVDANTLLIADIASPNSVRNIAENRKVSVSLLDIFRQRGVKLTGVAKYKLFNEATILESEKMLVEKAGDFPVKGIITVEIVSTSSLVAPSYWIKPQESVEEKVALAMKRYGVQPAEDVSSKN